MSAFLIIITFCTVSENIMSPYIDILSSLTSKPHSIKQLLRCHSIRTILNILAFPDLKHCFRQVFHKHSLCRIFQVLYNLCDFGINVKKHIVKSPNNN